MALIHPTMKIKPREGKRARAGSPWIFSNEIVMDAEMKALDPGEAVDVVLDDGTPLGTAIFNGKTLIAARLVSSEPGTALDADFFAARLARADAIRARLFPTPFYRVAHAEADGLPGLVVDRYGDVLSVQMGAAGMDVRTDIIVAALRRVFEPRAIVLRNDFQARTLEGLPSLTALAYGEEPGEIAFKENGATFLCDPMTGQKTGWFYDQRANRDLLERFVRGARVLDCFSYVGAWGIRAAALGAAEVTCLDASAQAVAQIESNAALNGLSGRVSAQMGDAFEALRELRQQRRRFDVVIVDPPAFAKRRKDFPEGRMAYRRINELAMRVLADDGILVSCSCSFHMPRDPFVDAVGFGAARLARTYRVLAHLGQAPDHPVLPAIPETAYLKGVVAFLPPAA